MLPSLAERFETEGLHIDGTNPSPCPSPRCAGRGDYQGSTPRYPTGQSGQHVAGTLGQQDNHPDDRQVVPTYDVSGGMPAFPGNQNSMWRGNA
ncbi:MAG: hypothetical protein ABSA83_23555 [Verrucomicrobiota bacterium]